MSEGIKSSLRLQQSKKSQTETVAVASTEVEYRQVGSKDDYIGQLSDEQKEAQFNNKREQYIKMKLTRKKELMLKKKQEFGASSSSEQDSSSEDQIEHVKPRLVQSKRSRGKIVEKSSSLHHDSYTIVLEVKKTKIDAELTLLEKQLQINQRAIPYSKIAKMSLGFSEDKMEIKMKVILSNDEELIIYSKDELQIKAKEKIILIFLQLTKIRLQSKGFKAILTENKWSGEQLSDKLRDGALIYDRLYKKSQIIGTWQQRYIVLRQDGLYSYRGAQSKNTMYIARKQVTQIATQFQFFKETLVVKLIYNSAKTDFGLPVDQKFTWLSHFCHLMVAQ